MFGLISFLLNLPFMLLNLVLSVVALPLKIIIRLLRRSPLLLILLVAAVVVYVRAQDSTPPRSLQPANPAGVLGQADAVTRHEDGDSAFSTDLYASMGDPEKAYYSQLFFWAMTTIADGNTHSWQNGNMAGTLQPTRSFTNAHGRICRNFNETLKVHTIQQRLTGTACQIDAKRWCKLKPNATPVCGLSRKKGGLGGMLDSVKRLF